MPKSKDEWVPIPGYLGIYWMRSDGAIRNAKKHVLRPQAGFVELRMHGIRERYKVDLLRKQLFGRKKG